MTTLASNAHYAPPLCTTVYCNTQEIGSLRAQSACASPSENWSGEQCRLAVTIAIVVYMSYSGRMPVTVGARWTMLQAN